MGNDLDQLEYISMIEAENKALKEEVWKVGDVSAQVSAYKRLSHEYVDYKILVDELIPMFYELRDTWMLAPVPADEDEWCEFVKKSESIIERIQGDT